MKTTNQTNVIMQRDEILHMLKNGHGAEVQDMIAQQMRENYPEQFVPFMDQMIKEHKISRKNVAIRSGLSQDYVYKLLRGDKHTDERDYILAMCMAIGMNLAQTQHALSSYGMPVLSNRDIRSHIIMLAIEDGDDIDELDAMLEKSNFPLLKTSPDMPSAKIMDTMPTAGVALEQTVQRPEEVETDDDESEEYSEFEEIDSFTEGHHNGGNAPFDYDYQGWIRLQDEQGNIYQVEAVFGQDYDSFLVFTGAQREEAERLMQLEAEKETEFYEAHKEVLEETDGKIDFFLHPELYEEYEIFMADIPVVEPMEYYASLAEAASSAFFTYFLELDKRTDKEVLKVLKKLDDTRECEHSMRFGSNWVGDEEPKVYIEMFNDKQPEKREYYQVVEYGDGSCRYTATHESCYMQLEMGQELYEVYFGEKREPEYFFNSDEEKEKGSMGPYKFIFTAMKEMLHEFCRQTGGFVTPENEVAEEDHLEFLVQQGILAHKNGDDRRSLEHLKEAICFMEERGAPNRKYLQGYVSTCWKLAFTCRALQEPEENEWWQRIYDLKDRIIEAADTENETGSVDILTDTVIRFYDLAAYEKRAEADRYVDEAMDLIVNHHACAENWEIQYRVYVAHAFRMEDVDLEQAMREYRQGLKIARNHHLDQVKYLARSVAVQYNNYAWVLWNKCGSEEAILYYGRSIDLFESYLFNGTIDHELGLAELKHVGNALNRIYLDTGRSKESERLKERLAENDVTLDQ